MGEGSVFENGGQIAKAFSGECVKCYAIQPQRLGSVKIWGNAVSAIGESAVVRSGRETGSGRPAQPEAIGSNNMMSLAQRDFIVQSGGDSEHKADDVAKTDCKCLSLGTEISLFQRFSENSPKAVSLGSFIS